MQKNNRADRGLTESLKSLTERASLLKQQGKLNAAIDVYADAARAWPSSAVAYHNLAGSLGDARRYVEAEKQVRKAFKNGLDAPETWLVLARALQGQLRDLEALEAFRKAVQKGPKLLQAQLELAQLVWMHSGDATAAVEVINTDIARFPQVSGLRYIRARILEFTLGPQAAYEAMREAIDLWPRDLGLLIPGASMAADAGATEEGLRYATMAQAVAPEDSSVYGAICYASLAAGEPERAAEMATLLHNRLPLDQHALALQWTAWRILDDPRHKTLYDYDTLVRPYMIDTPKGWPSLEAYLGDLAAALKSVHPYETHPFGQSVRSGSQLPNVLDFDLPPIRAFRSAIAGPISQHLEWLGQGEDPVRSRNTGEWEFDGIWSVWLKPGGYHHDHVHPDGWLSSACYIELPPGVEAGGQDGWIKFGEPGVVTKPRLGWEHAVKPSPGTLCLFPSYMWHGTLPFEGDSPRLTIAMDIVPA